MRYISTRGQSARLPFLDAVLTGQASDGGLLIPETIPNVHQQLDSWRSCSYQEVALEVLKRFIDDIPEADLRTIVNQSYDCFSDPKVVPLARVGNNFIAELFHGPTLAFKDIGLQLLGNFFEYAFSAKGQSRLNILCATSGDTGSAAIAAVKGRGNTTITVLHPRGNISRLQRLQMTTVTEDNVHNLGVAGTFDDCQRIIKSIFANNDFKKKHAIGAVNSVNWARILGQIVYYIYAWLQATENSEQEVVFVVPTGNFGNSFACWVAKKMGLPVKKIIVATNENDTLATFFNTGNYQRGPVRQTFSPAMDIQAASNIERYIYDYFNGDTTKVRAFFDSFLRQQQVMVSNGVPVDQAIQGVSISNEKTLETIASVWQTDQYMLDPHTATGFAASSEAVLPDNVIRICLATAHPAKFSEAMETALGSEHTPHHPSLDGLSELTERMTEIAADQSVVMDHIAGIDS